MNRSPDLASGRVVERQQCIVKDRMDCMKITIHQALENSFFYRYPGCYPLTVETHPPYTSTSLGSHSSSSCPLHVDVTLRVLTSAIIFAQCFLPPVNCLKTNTYDEKKTQTTTWWLNWNYYFLNHQNVDNRLITDVRKITSF